jgi:hypothetical protein
MYNRRDFLRTSAGVLALGGSALGLPTVSQDGLPDGSQARGMVTDESENAVKRGLKYLASEQGTDGSWGTKRYRGSVAVPSLAALAFMAGGHLPGRGKYGQNVERAVHFVLSQAVPYDRPGCVFLNRNDHTHGPMYGHGFGTLFLAEVYGMVQDKPLREEVRTTLQKAVELIKQGQSKDGGWRYRPNINDSDISVTVCQIMALRSARNAGIDVPKSIVDNCIEYVKRCQDKREGWFHYQSVGDRGREDQAFARSAAGLAALYSAGIYEGEEITRSLDYLMKQKPAFFPLNPDMFYFYGHYYAAQAMWTAGGDYWAKWFPAIRDQLVNGQRNRADGSWPDECSHYATAMACIILQVPNNYLPIMQK